MMERWRITLKPEGAMLTFGDAYRLYAWLLEQLPEEAAWRLHEEGGRNFSAYLLPCRETGTAVWCIQFLNAEAAPEIWPAVSAMGTQITLANGVSAVLADASRQETDGKALLLAGQQQPARRAEIRFLTPTAFRQAGRYAIFPQERLLLQSLAAAWNQAFPDISVYDEDAFRLLEQGLHITDYRLQTARYPLKGTKIPGFTGRITVEARLALPLLELWSALVLFAPYAGVGIKTGLGMGGVEAKVLSS